jgi:formyltetrahydrofolate deformylase
MVSEAFSVPDDKHSCILTITCPDAVGIVAAVTGYLSEQNYFIDESAHFGDHETGNFFSRIRFHADKSEWSEEQFHDGFKNVCEKFSMQCAVHDATKPSRAVIMVSKHDHCLNDLLYRYRNGSLHMEIPAIISNHQDLRSLAEWHNVPFHYVPITGDTRQSAEDALRQIFQDSNADLLILARYMQVLSDAFCQSMSGKVINIHHSFLPGFKGSRPYYQAHARGVKLIGATAHYVTPELDEGPIIEQTVERVDHTHGPKELTAAGRDVEAITLARAVRYHIEHRVFLNGNRTVVFR